MTESSTAEISIIRNSRLFASLMGECLLIDLQSIIHRSSKKCLIIDREKASIVLQKLINAYEWNVENSINFQEWNENFLSIFNCW